MAPREIHCWGAALAVQTSRELQAFQILGSPRAFPREFQHQCERRADIPDPARAAGFTNTASAAGIQIWLAARAFQIGRAAQAFQIGSAREGLTAEAF